MTFTKATYDVVNTYNGSGTATANQVLVLDANGKIPAINGANLTNITGGSGGLTWNTITTNTSASVNQGYICNSTTQLQINLPSTSTVGSIIEVTSINTGGWMIVPYTGQTINYGTLSASGIYTFVGSQYASMYLVYQGNNIWNADYATGTITTAAYGDPFFNNVTCLLPLNGSTTDYSNNALTLANVGGVSFVNNPGKFGNQQVAYFNGSSWLGAQGTAPGKNATYISGDFTVECWCYPTSLTGAAPAFIETRSGGSQNGMLIWYNQSNNNQWVFTNVSADNAVGGIGTLVTNAWQHVACTRQGSKVSIFVNGNLATTATFTNNFSQGYLTIGINVGGASGGFTGYMSNYRLTNGVARYTANFTPPTTYFPLALDTTADPVWNKTVFETGFEGNFLDVSNTSTSLYNNGLPAAYFNGSTSYVGVSSPGTAYNLSGNFTVEAWVYPTAAGQGGDTTIIGSTTTNSLKFLQSNGAYTIGAAVYGASAFITSTIAMTPNAWNHVACTRSGTTFSLWVNGVSAGSASQSAAFASSMLNVGGGQSSAYFTGYIQDARVVNGTAVYTSNFTPPTSQLVAITNTTALFHLNSNVTDSSTSNLVATNNNVTWGLLTNINNVVLYSPKFGSTAAYFNGSTAYLTVATPGNATKFAGDFTLECWTYLTGGAGTYRVLFESFPSTTATTTGFQLYVNTSNNWVLETNATGNLIANAGASTIGSWVHVALVRQASNITFYLNGTASATITNTTNFSDGGITIGKSYTVIQLWPGYIQDFRIVNGTAVYTANFTPPTTALTAITNTTALFHLTTDASDSSTNTLLATNNLVNFVGPKVGSYSAIFNGSNYLQNTTITPANFTGDFTIEAWVFPTANGTGNTTFCVCLGGFTSNTTGCASLGLNASNQLVAYMSGATLTPSATLTLNTWQHIALVRSGSLVSAFINGVSVVTGTSTNALSGTGLCIGAIYNTGNNNNFIGLIDQVRISQFARYTSNFTPSATAYPTALPVAYDPYWQDTTFQIGFENGFSDQSGNNLVLTNTGTAVWGPQYNASSSALFNGSTSYISVATPGSAAQFSGPFTIEAWIYPTSLAVSGGFNIIDTRTNNTSAAGISFGQYAANSPYLNAFWTGGSVTGTTGALVANQWQHVALTRNSSNVMNIWLNGVLTATATYSNNFSNGQISIGQQCPGAAAACFFPGFMQDFRINNTTAVYTANFTPPTSQLTAITNTTA